MQVKRDLNSQKKTRALLIVVFVFMGLSTVIAKTTDVYVAGYLDNEKGKSVATVWKNSEKLYQLTDGERDAYANGIYVSGSDVYVAGTEVNAAGRREGRVWKNGERLYSFTHSTQDVFAYSVIVSGSDVYIAGNWQVTGTANYTGKVWKNGTELYSFNGSVTRMCILNNDIYVGGQSGGEAKVWKNGTVCWTTNTTGFSPSVQHMCISNGEIYVSFNFTSYTEVYIAKIIQGGYSFNQIWTQSFPSGYSSVRATSFAVSGSNVYALINSTMPNYTPQMHIYKNGTADSRAGWSGTMYLFDDDIYLAVRNLSYKWLKVYKNGEELYILNEGGTNDNISDILVVERSNIGINNIEVNEVLVYPNPVKDKLLIQTELGIDKIEIYDMLGKEVLIQTTNDKTEINISHLPQGIYNVRIFSEGKVVGKSKIVKQ